MLDELLAAWRTNQRINLYLIDRISDEAELEASSQRIEAFFERCVTGEGRHRPSKKGVVTTLAYFVAHESHHRGNILLTLKQCGHAPPQADRYAIRNWDKL